MKSDLVPGDTEDATKQSLSDRDSPLGRYYQWLLCDPTAKDYWTTRATNRDPSGRPRDQEEG